MPRCPIVLAWLRLQLRSKRVQIHMLQFVHKDETTHTFPSICSNPCATATFKAGSQQLLAVRMVNNGTSDSRWRHGINVFGPVDLVSCIVCVPTHVHAQKALNFELRLFKKCRVGIVVK